MAQKFDIQYFNSLKYKKAEPLDINTESIRHSITDISQIYKTLMHRMRMIAKTNWTIKETKEKRKPRISYCGYSLHSNTNQPVQLCKSTKGNLFFNGLANCGSYWRCPVCALKISESKKELLTDLISSHIENKNTIGFLTLTIRHNRNDTLKKSIDKLLNNFNKFQNQRFFSRNKKDFNYLGMVKTLEVTFSFDNGWHPHLHVLFFYNNSNSKTIENFQKQFIKNWSNFRDNDSLLKAQNQQIISSVTDLANYVAKYDISSEMTKGQIKGSKGLTPFTALAKLALNDYEDIQEKRLLYGVYSSYVEYTQGRAFVFISKAIRTQYKDIIELKDKTDEEIVNNVEIDEILLKISTTVWKLISKNDLQPLVLNKYKENGIDGVYNLLTFFKDFKLLSVELDKNQIPLLI